MMEKKVTIGVVLFGTKYLDKSLTTLTNQDYPNIEFIFRDQEEGVHTAAEYIKSHLPEVAKKITLHKGKNLWHGGGHNAIIREMTGDYYFCCSNDMLYPSDFVSKIVKSLTSHPDHSFATCKIMHWDFENNKKTHYIDSFGIGMTPYHHFYDIGQGEGDKGQYDKLKEPWGTSGALSIFSKKALESIKFRTENRDTTTENDTTHDHDNTTENDTTENDNTTHDHDQYFDERMHYKNDVDLSYRLRLAGQKPLLIHDTKVYHDRQAAKDSKKSYFAIKSSFIGERILMKKIPRNTLTLKVRIKTAIYHTLKTAYRLITHPSLIKYL